MEARTGELFQVGSPRRADVEAATGGYRVRVSQALEDPAWDAFLARAFDGHHVQNSAWAQVKSALGWRSKRVVLNGPSGPVAGAQILFRSVHPIGNMAFLSRGPVWASGDDVLFRQTMREILKVTRQRSERVPWSYSSRGRLTPSPRSSWQWASEQRP